MQICADDPQVVSAAMRSLRARIPGYATLRWTQSGFLSPAAAGGTPRTMFGQKDGTTNPRLGSAALAETVWALHDEPDWFTGGTDLVLAQRRSAEQDRLNRFVTHTGSAILAILPGFGVDGYLGDTLLGSNGGAR